MEMRQKPVRPVIYRRGDAAHPRRRNMVSSGCPDLRGKKRVLPALTPNC